MFFICKVMFLTSMGIRRPHSRPRRLRCLGSQPPQHIFLATPVDRSNLCSKLTSNLVSLVDRTYVAKTDKKAVLSQR